jgi:dienelactone hydrolase
MSEAATVTNFREREIRFANGSQGIVVQIQSANPLNYHQAISAPAAMPQASIDGKLFLPPGAKGPVPVVIVVPGSLTVAPSHLAHAERFTDMGLAAFVLDPFGGRGVTSTVANQTQFSFAASAYDVLAAVQALAAMPEIDAGRIGAQGHSRGGAAVLSAAARRFAEPILGKQLRLARVLAAYPWCGQQFRDPDIGGTVVRVLIGDRDQWCSVQQAQGHVQAMRLRGGDADIRIFAGAQHSFDRGPPVWRIAEASVSPGAPTSYIADDGAFIHPATGLADAKLVDRDLMVYALKAGYGVKGASLGSSSDAEAQLFVEDMLAFWRPLAPA